MGKTFIRFGRYVTRERRIEPFRETWLNEDFQVSFISYDFFHWRMELLKDENWTIGGYGRSEFYGRGFKLNERHLDPYRTQKYPVACQVGIFKAPGDRLQVRLSWALPKNRLGHLKLYESYHVDLEEGVFLFSDNGDLAVDESRRIRVLTDAWRDTLRSNYILEQAEIFVDPGSYRLVPESRDSGSRSIGMFRDSVDLRPFGTTNLGMCSAFLATDVVRGENDSLVGIPNPIWVYKRSEIMYVYFEAYNLAKDSYGQTRYQVEYRIGRPEAGRLPIKLGKRALKWLGLQEESWSVSVAAEYAGEKSDGPVYLGVDLEELKPGLQLLTLVLRDQMTSRMALRETFFRIAE